MRVNVYRIQVGHYRLSAMLTYFLGRALSRTKRSHLNYHVNATVQATLLNHRKQSVSSVSVVFLRRPGRPIHRGRKGLWIYASRNLCLFKDRFLVRAVVSSSYHVSGCLGIYRFYSLFRHVTWFLFFWWVTFCQVGYHNLLCGFPYLFFYGVPSGSMSFVPFLARCPTSYRSSSKANANCGHYLARSVYSPYSFSILVP